MDQILILIFQLIVLLFSVIIHEVSHGYAAERLGDPTARLAGRLTLNPLKHLDPFGSVLLPLLLFFVSRGSFVFGWAKPVPYNPFNLKKPRSGSVLIALAGPLSNISMALIFGGFLRLILAFGSSALGPAALFFGLIVFVNLLLAVFNLVPIPPLDGSKLLLAILPESAVRLRQTLEIYGFILLIVFIIFLFPVLLPIINFLFSLIVGVPGF